VQDQEAAAGTLDDAAASYAAEDAVAAVQAFQDSMQQLGRAQVGDKTLLDSLVPFVDALSAAVAGGASLADAWSSASAEAAKAAEATQDLRPAVGRARPLAEKSLGTPDAGAVSMAMILGRIAEHLR
ncbi:DAK2 domain-containing protein, partial [Actinocorallia glomerata]|uniref:DAK2 domain-containing protein n=1 Tax=Actinocorallia glomerata TaxID=46203 RepID=UPI0031DD6F35